MTPSRKIKTLTSKPLGTPKRDITATMAFLEERVQPIIDAVTYAAYHSSMSAFARRGPKEPAIRTKHRALLVDLLRCDQKLLTLHNEWARAHNMRFLGYHERWHIPVFPEKLSELDVGQPHMKEDSINVPRLTGENPARSTYGSLGEAHSGSRMQPYVESPNGGHTTTKTPAFSSFSQSHNNATAVAMSNKSMQDTDIEMPDAPNEVVEVAGQEPANETFSTLGFTAGTREHLDTGDVFNHTDPIASLSSALKAHFKPEIKSDSINIDFKGKGKADPALIEWRAQREAHEAADRERVQAAMQESRKLPADRYESSLEDLVNYAFAPGILDQSPGEKLDGLDASRYSQAQAHATPQAMADNGSEKELDEDAKHNWKNGWASSIHQYYHFRPTEKKPQPEHWFDLIGRPFVPNTGAIRDANQSAQSYLAWLKQRQVRFPIAPPKHPECIALGNQLGRSSRVVIEEVLHHWNLEADSNHGAWYRDNRLLMLGEDPKFEWEDGNPLCVVLDEKPDDDMTICDEAEPMDEEFEEY